MTANTPLFPHLPPKGAKICGIKTIADYEHCKQQKAAFVGMVFFEKSPRHLSFDDAQAIADHASHNASQPAPIRVALCVNASDQLIDDIARFCRPDMFQLHGSEGPSRTHEIKTHTNTPVMKAFRVKNQADIAAAEAYYEVADWLLFDADSGNPDLPGGTGHHFDWSLVSQLHPPLPWMLAGGLRADNLAQAQAQTPACYFDVSSAVEREKGIKDHQLITNFISAIK